MANPRFWAYPTREPKRSSPFTWVFRRKEKHSSPSRDQRNEMRERNLTERQKERIRIMSGAFNDEEVDEKVALGNSQILDVMKGDVLVGQGGRYLHPRLFRVI